MPFFTWPFRAQSNQNYNLWYVEFKKDNKILITIYDDMDRFHTNKTIKFTSFR